MPWSETENGSASTACSSLTLSGTGMHIDSWAGTNGAKPPVAALLLPVWMPRGMIPRAKFRQLAERGGRERPEEEPLVDPTEERRHDLSRDAHVADERAHGEYQSPGRGGRKPRARLWRGARLRHDDARMARSAVNPRRALPS